MLGARAIQFRQNAEDDSGGDAFNIARAYFNWLDGIAASYFAFTPAA
jgi:hypothetical protein